jgi:hypothetical protein
MNFADKHYILGGLLWWRTSNLGMHRSSLHGLCLTSPGDRSARPLTQGARRRARAGHQSSCEARRDPPRHQAAAELVGAHHLRDPIATELAGALLPHWPPALGAPLHTAAPSDSRSSPRPAPTRLEDASVPGTARRGLALPASLL